VVAGTRRTNTCTSSSSRWTKTCPGTCSTTSTPTPLNLPALTSKTQDSSDQTACMVIMFSRPASRKRKWNDIGFIHV
jgi:hypothetical protein